MNKNTISTNIVWHDASKDPPKKSGMYLVVTPNGHITIAPYSAKHNLFNFDDHLDPISDREKYAFTVSFWAEVPDAFLYKNLESFRKRGDQ